MSAFFSTKLAQDTPAHTKVHNQCEAPFLAFWLANLQLAVSASLLGLGIGP